MHLAPSHGEAPRCAMQYSTLTHTHTHTHTMPRASILASWILKFSSFSVPVDLFDLLSSVIDEDDNLIVDLSFTRWSYEEDVKRDSQLISAFVYRKTRSQRQEVKSENHKQQHVTR